MQNTVSGIMIMTIISTIFTIVNTFISIGVWAAICPSDYNVEFTDLSGNKHCFHQSTQMTDAYNAEATCNALSPPGHLVTVETQERFDFLVSKSTTRHWIGLYDAKHGYHIERDWRWTSGEAVNVPWLGFDDSQPDEYKQPNGYALGYELETKQDCGIVMKMIVEWQDKPCSDYYRFWCESAKKQDDVTPCAIKESIGLFSGGFSVIFNDMTCMASIIDEITSASTMRCLQVCSITDNCAAVSYMKEDRACQLLTSTIGCVVYKKGSLIHIKQPCQ